MYKKDQNFLKIFESLSSELKERKPKKIFGHLTREIIKTGKCIRCGACTSVCDVLDWDKDTNFPKLTGKCDACSTCYFQCPAAQNNFNLAEEIVLKSYSGVSMLKELSNYQQNGGIVTAIIHYLIKEEKYDGAVIVKKNQEEPWIPEAGYVENIEDIKSGMGTIYSHAQTIPPLVENIVLKNAKKIVFVGTPCNIDSVFTMLKQDSGFLSKFENIEIFKIGLFCMEAFEPESLLSQFITDEIDLERTTKMEISSGKFKVFYGDKKKKSYSISSLEDKVDSSCHFCKDFTALNSDISVGNVGTDDGSNTIIVRNEKALDIIKNAREHGYLELNPLDHEGLEKVEKIIVSKKEKEIPMKITPPQVQKDKFILHEVKDWKDADYGYTPEVNEELYVKKEYDEIKINDIADKELKESKLGEKSKIYIAKAPDMENKGSIPYNYSSAYDLTIKLLENYDKIKDGKILVKPNNTGFVGVFKTDALMHVLEKNGITDNADDQPIATPPTVLKGMVDALLHLGAKRVDVAENMLWNGGTPRAFFETGYTKIFDKPEYKKKVFFVDFYENDPPTSSLERLGLEPTDYCKVDYYNRAFPPKALFEEKYDLIYIASVIKTHNCSVYSLSVKNFSVSWNPRKTTGKIPPRWHIHGLPVDIFLKNNIKTALGDDFKRKYKYFVREVYSYPYKNPDQKERIVKKKKRKVIITNELSSSGLMDTIQSWGNYAFDVDPHHWTGINMSVMNLGIGYLITRYTRIFSAVVKKLAEVGTRVACLCSGIVAQEKDGPLVYGCKKYGGFSVASFDHVALEKVLLDMMFGTDDSQFKGFITNYQKDLMNLYDIKDPMVMKDAEEMWMLKMLKEFIGGELDNNKMNITLLDYAKEGKFSDITPETLYKLRTGDIFEYSRSFFVSPTAWLHALHTDDGLAKNAFIPDKKSIEIPLIPGVCK